MKKKLFICSISIVLICIIVVGGVYASNHLNLFQWGEQKAKIDQTQNDNAIAIINGVEISQDKFDSYKAGLANASGTFTDDEILDTLIEQEVIMQEIERLGYTVTDDEVTSFNDDRFALLDNDQSAYQITKDHVDGMGITMEEYKEMSKEISRIALLTNMYQADLLKQFESSSDNTILFRQYFEDEIKSLHNNATIEILK